jgi:patatin-like phospholipase/acyl hydrolase
MSNYRILSIDGGGIRGIIPVILLQRLSAETGLAGWLDKVDLLAGTSTGGLIALGLAAGKPLEEIRDIYVTKASEIFDTSTWHTISHLGNLFGAKYDIGNLEKVIKPYLGETTTLASLAKKVLIASFLLDSGPADPRGRTWKPKIFHNFKGEDSDGGELAYKVGLYTSAAPTYFQPDDGYVDGGVFASNPSMCALAQTQDSRIGLDRPISDLALLSLGTGISLEYIDKPDPDWGEAQWIKPLIEIMLDGVSGIADYQCRKILGDRYQRLAPIFPIGTAIAMDDIGMIQYMTDFANGVDLTATVDWLRVNWI